MNGTYQTYRKFSDAVTKQPPIFLRDLLDFRNSGRKALDSDDVESLNRHPQALRYAGDESWGLKSRSPRHP